VFGEICKAMWRRVINYIKIYMSLQKNSYFEHFVQSNYMLDVSKISKLEFVTAIWFVGVPE
jgi:hypothetical protein